VREAVFASARAHTHEAFFITLAITDVARLALRVVRAFRDRDRDGLLVFFLGVVLFGAAAATYFLADLLVAAAAVFHLASPTTVSGSGRTSRSWMRATSASYSY